MDKPLSGTRVLIVTPSFPIPEVGAEQSDRGNGIRQFKRLGAEVVVIAKVSSHADTGFIQKTAEELGVRVCQVPYRYSERALTFGEKLKKTIGKFTHPLYLDGAAYEYTEPEVQRVFARELDEFKPDVVWFEYTYLWPLYKAARTRRIPIITRSINFEPEHFLEEDGYTFINYLKFIPKFFGEWRTVRWSDVMLSITPKEERIYTRLGARHAFTLPLRGLPRFTMLPDPEIRDRKPLHAFFMGSTYNVAHNKAALAYILKDIAPQVERTAPGAFVFHVIGKKVPHEFEHFFNGKTIVYDGPKYNEELESFLSSMDVAVVPSLMGAGQQQKVFEPITRGFPTVTSTRPIAEYALTAGEQYVAAWTPEEFVRGLNSLVDASKRRSLSQAARMQTQTIFGQDVLDGIVVKAIQRARSGL